MSIYDMTFALSFKIDEEKREELLKKIESFIGQNQGKIEKINQLGRKKFAYEVDKEKEGFFTTLTFQIEPAFVGDVYKFVKSEDPVMRLMLIKKKKKLSLKKINQEGEGDAHSK